MAINPFLSAKSRQRGDTLVEVLLATVVLSIVVAGAFTLTNRASRINQSAFERTLVSGALQQQAELLRGARNVNTPAAGEIWDDILDMFPATPVSTTLNCETLDLEATVLATTLASRDVFTLSPDDSAPGYIVKTDGHLVDGFYRYWIEAIDGGSYADFIITACWPGQGTGINNVSGIAIRLDKQP